MRSCFAFLLVLLAACARADGPVQHFDEQTIAAWSWQAQYETLKNQSCPAELPFEAPDKFEVRVKDVDRGSETAQVEHLKGLSLAGAWELDADKVTFGGFSGLEVLPSGALLTISDRGGFGIIGMDSLTGIPDGTGEMTWMRDADGNYYMKDHAADAEGLTYREGLALVSFERTHRIEAFAIDQCGNAARGAHVASIESAIDGHKIAKNSGAEALALDGDALILGFEMKPSEGSPRAILLETGAFALRSYTEQPGPYLMTGMDREGDVDARLFRAYDPIQGPRAILQVDRAGVRVAEAHIKKPLPVDNFEGVAIGAAPDGKTRIWLISDDNFRRSQRTLLLALDLD